jgi:hypothetical protein
MNEQENEYDKLAQELEAKEVANDMFSMSIESSYEILAGTKTVAEACEDETILFCDPMQYPTSAELDEMIYYFESTEEYEKCAFLLKTKLRNEL